MRCKEGDLAVILKSHCKNEGAFVTIQSYVPDANAYTFPSGQRAILPGWSFRSKTILNTMDDFTGEIFRDNGPDRYLGVLPDDWLQPIRPPGLNKDIQIQQSLPALV